MGILFNLLTFPASGPIKGVKWISEKIQEVADQNFTDRSRQQAELIELSILRETDQVTEEEFKKKEEAILKRMGAGEERKKGK